MSTVASLVPQTSSQATGGSFDSQIKALEKRIAGGVKNGTITAQQGKEMTKVLEEVKNIVDASGASTSLSAADNGKISQLLREVGQKLAGASQNAASQTSSGATDSDGDGDGSVGLTTLA